MRLELVTPATTAPVTLAEAKLFARVDDSTEDALMTEIVSAATKHVEEFTGRQLVTATWKLYLDDFPDADVIQLPKSPLQSVTSVKYLDENNVEQTLSSSYYQVLTKDDPGAIELLPSYSWPSTYGIGGQVRIQYVAGYGAATYVPEGLKLAVKMIAAHWFGLGRDVAISGTIVTEIPKAVDLLLWQYRTGLLWWDQ